MENNVVSFPKPFKHPPLNPDIEDKDEYTQEIIAYDDGSVVVVMLPDGEKLTPQKLVFVAERLKMDAFDFIAEDNFEN